MCHSLVMNYGLYKRMEIFVRVTLRTSYTRGELIPCFAPEQRAKPATKREMTQFHSDEYVEFLSKISPSNMNSFIKEQHKCDLFVFIMFSMHVHHTNTAFNVQIMSVMIALCSTASLTTAQSQLGDRWVWRLPENCDA